MSSAAATEISALKSQLESSSSDPASAVTESQVRVELEQVRGLLDRYQRIFGQDAETADDVRQLGEKLEQADKENKRLQLQLEEADASTNALYTEVEGLSKLYEELDAKVKSKCFELKDGELKLQRLITEVSPVSYVSTETHLTHVESQGGQQVLCSNAGERRYRRSSEDGSADCGKAEQITGKGTRG
jgi:seryl-tRNA synthetase